MRLDALPAESAGELLDALLGDDPGRVPLQQLLVRRGNPFFLEETVPRLVQTRTLHPDDREMDMRYWLEQAEAITGALR